MRIHELLFEARPENLNQPTLDKLFAAYQNKDSRDNNYKSENGLEVAQHIFSVVGPSYLNWVVKQYTNDQYFFLHDLPILSDQINKFVKLTRTPRATIERDLNRYSSINDLNQAVIDATGGELTGTQFYQRAILEINKFVNKGEARWLYRGNNYSIYQPMTWKSSEIMGELLWTNLCTIKGHEAFDSYIEDGVLMYIITQDKLFNCYIHTKQGKHTSEFADQRNNHDFDLDWQIEHFPALEPLIRKVFNKYSGVKVILKFENDPVKIKRMCLFSVQQNAWALSSVPEELRDREMCLTAVQKDGKFLYKVPLELRDREMCLAAVKQNSFESFKYVPQELRDREMCLIAVKQHFGPLHEVPLELRDREMCLAAVQHHPEALGDVPLELRDREMCLTAVKQKPHRTTSNYSFQFVPEELRDREMCLAAVIGDLGSSWKYFPKKIKDEFRIQGIV